MSLATNSAVAGGVDINQPSGLLLAALRQVIEEHRTILALGFVYVAVGTSVLAWWFDGIVGRLAAAYPAMLAGNAVIIASVACLWTIGFLARTRPAHPFGAVGRAFTQPDVWPTVIARILILVPVTALVMGTFSALKPHIPLLHPFSFDPEFIAIDAWLHGGVQPWTLIQPWLGRPLITAALDSIYYLWFPFLYHTFYWQVFTLRQPALRLQFLIAFMLSWMLIGTAAAIAFSSVGPVFLAGIGIDDSAFRELLAYLRTVNETRPLFALEVQEWLWQSYLGTDPTTPLKGISAMPSMHVAMVALFVLLGWRRNWLIGIGYLAVAILIFLGSIQLAFHYAVDGYVAAIMVIAVWWIAGQINRQSLARNGD